MYSPELIVRELLIADAVGTVGTTPTQPWQVKVGAYALTPNEQLVVFRTGGREPNPRYLLNEITVQVQTRGPNGGYAAAAQKAQDVQDSLLGLTPQTLHGDRWDGIYGMGDVAFLQYDESDRPIFVVNFRIVIEPAATALTNRESLG